MEIALLVFLAACGVAVTHHQDWGSTYSKYPFDEHRFSGDWFGIGFGKTKDEILGITCAKIHYSLTGQGNDTRIEIAVNFKRFGDDVKHLIKGQPSVPGVNSALQTVLIKGEEANSTDEKSLLMKHSIVATDYDTWALIQMNYVSYDKEADLFTRNADLQIWSRTKTLDAVILNTLTIVGNGLNPDNFDDVGVTDNSDC